MKKEKIVIIILNIINFAISFLFIGLLVYLNILPKKYLIIFTISILLLDIILIISTLIKKKIIKIIGIILISLIIIIQSIGIYFAYKGNSFFNNAFNNISDTTNVIYYLITYSDNETNIIDDKIYYINDSTMKNALEKLKNNNKNEVIESNNINDLFNQLLNKKIKYIFINESTYQILLSNNKKLKNSNFRILNEYTIKKKNNKIESSNNISIFNIYVNGKDFANINDFNMIITVNMNSHKILLTSIPRDYHIDVYGMDGMKDNLCFIGMDDINISIKSLEQLFNIKIDYYLKINTHSLVEVVDAVGGINYCSDKSFTTTHSLVLDTYNDTYSNKLTIKEGCQHLNGIQTLTLARERNAFPGSDIQRQKNCQAIIVDIFEALKNTNTIVNFDNILNKLSNLYETNISKEIVQKMINDTIDDKTWTFIDQTVYGEDSPTGRIHMNTFTGWIMIPDMNTVEIAKEEIKKFLKKD